MTSFFDSPKHLVSPQQPSSTSFAWEGKSKLPVHYDSSLAFASQNAEIDKLAEDYRTHKALSRRESVPVIGTFGRLYDNDNRSQTLPSRHFSIHEVDGFRKPAVDLYNQRSSSTSNLSGFYANQRVQRIPEPDYFARRSSLHQMNVSRHIYTQPFISERIPSPATFEDFSRDEYRSQVFSPGRLTRKSSLHSEGSEFAARLVDTPRESSPRGFFDPFGSTIKASSHDVHTIMPLPPSRSRTNSGTASSPSPLSAKFDFFAGASSGENHTSPSSSEGSPSRTPVATTRKPAPIGTRDTRQTPTGAPVHRDDQAWTSAMWAGKGPGVVVGASDSCW